MRDNPHSYSDSAIPAATELSMQRCNYVPLGPLPPQVLKKYEIWKDIVFRHGQDKLKEFPGFNDERLRGEREGQRSSRRNVKYRVIYSVEETVVSVRVLEIAPHEY